MRRERLGLEHEAGQGRCGEGSEGEGGRGGL